MRRRPPPKNIPADGSPIKTLFGLYQCLHHLSILTGNAGTGKSKPFSKKADELDRFFRPALSDPTIRKQIHDSNLEWAQNQTKNLVDHYTWQSEALKGCISAWNLTTSEMNSNLTKARDWVKRHFGNKFRKNIFDQVDKIVRNFAKSESNATRRPVACMEPTPSSSDRTVHESRACAAATPSTSTQNQTATRSGDATVSTPANNRKRERLASSPETSPSQSQTPKKPRTSSTYANVASSPPFGPNANKPNFSRSPAVHRFPKLGKKKGQEVLSIWEIPKLTKDILVLGTSNLSRISFVKRRDVQILSYPGLSLHYLLKILASFKFGPGSPAPGLKPSHVVLSVGLNDRTGAPSTNETNIKKVLIETEKQFPGSKISVCQIRYSSDLPAKEINAIKQMNACFQKECEARGMKFIPGVPFRKFAVHPKDNIHWTENCANSTIEHIFDHLN